MNLGKFRELTKTLPDDTEITVCDGIDTFEVYEQAKVYPPVNEYTYLIMCDIGQQVDLQFDLDEREATSEIQN